MAQKQGAGISKSRADRAGEIVRAFWKKPNPKEHDVNEVLDAYDDVATWRQTHVYPLALVTPGVRSWVGQESDSIVVAQRMKRMPQIALKLTRFPTMRVTQMEDVGGCRAVLRTPAEVEAVARRIERQWKVKFPSDYREEGKPGTGYRALHYIVERRERLIEVQLRTPGQHSWAEVVERTASRLDYDLKDGDGPAELIEYFRLASDVIWAQENGVEVDEGVMTEFENLREQVRPYFVRSQGRNPG